MKHSTALNRALACGVLGLTALTSACVDPATLAANSGISEASLAAARSQNSLSDAQLARLAKCESGGNPNARSSSGAYMGLYQFDQRTWNGIARQIMPEYVGVRPNNAPAWVQDAMARKLYSQRGRQPWPVCGRRM